jgi:hypothetical protein
MESNVPFSGKPFFFLNHNYLLAKLVVPSAMIPLHVYKLCHCLFIYLSPTTKERKLKNRRKDYELIFTRVGEGSM